MLDGFLFCCNFVSADSCGICEEGKHSEFRRPFPLLALLPSGHGKRAVARVAGKAPAADRLRCILLFLRTGCCKQPLPMRFRRRRTARQAVFGN